MILPFNYPTISLVAKKNAISFLAFSIIIHLYAIIPRVKIIIKIIKNRIKLLHKVLLIMIMVLPLIVNAQVCDYTSSSVTFNIGTPATLGYFNSSNISILDSVITPIGWNTIDSYFSQGDVGLSLDSGTHSILTNIDLLDGVFIITGELDLVLSNSGLIEIWIQIFESNFRYKLLIQIFDLNF